MASKPYADRSHRVWRMKYRPDPAGPWKTVVLGPDPRITRTGNLPKNPPHEIAVLAAKYADLEYKAKHGMVAPAAGPKSLRQYADQYLKGYPARRDPGSVILANRYINRFVDWCTARGINTIQGLTKGHCKDYLDERVRHSAPNTVKTERGYIAALWSRAVDDEIIAANPWSKAKLPKGTKAEKTPRFWSPEEVHRIAAACYLDWHRDLVILLANTGIRISGMLAMEWDWIDWKAQTIKVPIEHNKGGFDYTLFMTEDAREILERRRKSSHSRYVFPSRIVDGPCRYRGAAEAIRRAMRRAKVPEGTPHDLRHTLGRALHLAGVPQSVIAAMLGHASIATTEIYTRMEDADAVAFIKRMKLGSRSSGPSGESECPPARADE